MSLLRRWNSEYNILLILLGLFLQINIICSRIQNDDENGLFNSPYINHERILREFDNESQWSLPASFNTSKFVDHTGAVIEDTSSNSSSNNTDWVLQYDAAAIGGRDKMVITYAKQYGGTYEAFYTVRKITNDYNLAHWNETTEVLPKLLNTANTQQMFPRVAEITSNSGNFVICYNQCVTANNTDISCRFYKDDYSFQTNLEMDSLPRDEQLLDLNIYALQNNNLIVTWVARSNPDAQYRVFAAIVNFAYSGSIISASKIIQPTEIAKSSYLLEQPKALWLKNNNIIFGYSFFDGTKHNTNLKGYKLSYTASDNIYSFSYSPTVFPTEVIETNTIEASTLGFDIAYVSNYGFLLVYVTDTSELTSTVTNLNIRYYNITEKDLVFSNTIKEVVSIDVDASNNYANYNTSRPSIVPLYDQNVRFFLYYD